MRASLAVLLAIAAAGARADPPSAAGPIFGVRAGLGVPYGDVARGGPRIEDLVARKVPLGLELGYRFDRRVWGELSFDLGPATTVSGLCAGGTSCSASDLRLGLAVVVRGLPQARLDPWLAVGIGVEVLNAKGLDPASGADSEWSWAGIELPFVEGGVDLAVSDQLGVGPWVSVTVAQFTSESLRPAGGSTASGSVKSRATHGWLSGGLKATLRL